MASARIRVRRVHRGPARGDGQRVLVDRLWPRGVSREAAALDAWLRDVAPSTGLRKWFGHDPERWSEFRRRYHHELDRHPDAVAPLLERLSRGRVTLVFGARDERHNNAVALRDYLERRL